MCVCVCRRQICVGWMCSRPHPHPLHYASTAAKLLQLQISGYICKLQITVAVLLQLQPLRVSAWCAVDVRTFCVAGVYGHRSAFEFRFCEMLLTDSHKHTATHSHCPARSCKATRTQPYTATVLQAHIHANTHSHKQPLPCTLKHSHTHVATQSHCHARSRTVTKLKRATGMHKHKHHSAPRQKHSKHHTHPCTPPRAAHQLLPQDAAAWMPMPPPPAGVACVQTCSHCALLDKRHYTHAVYSAHRNVASAVCLFKCVHAVSGSCLRCL